MTRGKTGEKHCRPPFDRGLYLFLLRLREPAEIKVGALGTFIFPNGWYIYTGRARRNLRQRVERHLSTKRRRRWHIDYLTTIDTADRIVPELDDPAHDECWANQRVGRLLAAEAVVPGFGASDCVDGCPAHLWFSFRPLSLLEIRPLFPDARLLLPPPLTDALRVAETLE